jgi:hypothetical protein
MSTLAGYPAGYPVSGLTGYPAVKSGIRPDTGYQKRPDYPAGYPVHPYFLSANCGEVRLRTILW